jgi:Domain of unknown function (DUF4835)
MKKLIIIYFLIISSISFAQELECTVTVNYESLPTNNRVLLEGFGQAVQDYMNMTRFTGKDWVGPKIPCTINVLFVSASSDIDYSAQVVIVSQRAIYDTITFSPMLRINDNTWSFKYEKGQTMYGNQSTFDPLTSFLDYYANVIIGFDYDSYEELGGTEYFSKAFGIVTIANSSGSSNGWTATGLTYSRWNLVSDLMNDKFRAFREAFYNYHYNGLDIFNNKKYRAIALENIANLVHTLEELRTKVDLNTTLIRAFFDAKNGEIADYLKYTNDPSLFTTLKKIDPRHLTRYDDAMKTMR